MAFKGFPNETLKFLIDLRTNNSKKWFDANRQSYDQYYVGAAKAFVEAAAPRLQKLSAGISAEPRINGSIFRINRDVRFGKDKRPYKDHLDFAFWEGDRKSAGSSLFLRISPDGVILGTGFHQGCPQRLKLFREAVAEQKSGKQLASVTAKLRKKGLQLHGQHYKRIPRGFSEDGPAAEFLLHDSLYVMREEDVQTACETNFLSTCVRHWRGWMPLHRWLSDNVRKTP